MTDLQVLSVLLNRGLICRKQSSVRSKDSFKVMLTEKRHDRCVGHISLRTFENLITHELIVPIGPPLCTMDGYYLTWYKLGKGDLSFLYE